MPDTAELRNNSVETTDDAEDAFSMGKARPHQKKTSGDIHIPRANLN